MSDWTLFRGQAIGTKVARLGGGVTRLTIDCEDYNRLFSRALVGAPDGRSLSYQDDGTAVPIDPYAFPNGSTDAEVFEYLMDAYWPGPTLSYSAVTSYARNTLIETEWQTATTDLRSVLDEVAAQSSGSLHYWIDPDLIAHWRELDPSNLPDAGVEPAQMYILGWPTKLPPASLLVAPYELVSESPDMVTEILPMSLDVSWDYSQIANRAYIKGGTPAPAGSGWVDSYSSVPYAGEIYIDSANSTTWSDRYMVGTYHFVNDNRALLTGTATVSPGYDGWRVGQTLYVTDAVLSRYRSHALSRTPTVIQRITGHLIGPGPGLTVTVGGIDVTERMTTAAFDFEETLGSPGKATITLEIVDPAVTQRVGDLSEVVVTSDGTAAIEYTIEFGDVPFGELPRRKRPTPKPAPPPANRFLVTIANPGITAGYKTQVTAQIADAAGNPLFLPNVYLQWVLLQWSGDGNDEILKWKSQVDFRSGNVAYYQGIIDRGGTLNAKQTLAFTSNTWRLGLAQTALADAVAAAEAAGTLTVPGDGWSLLDGAGVTDATGRAYTYLSHDTPGTTVLYTVDAVSLPL